MKDSYLSCLVLHTKCDEGRLNGSTTHGGPAETLKAKKRMEMTRAASSAACGQGRGSHPDGAQYNLIGGAPYRIY